MITGGDSGIGRAIAIAYAREGANVVISYLEEEKDAQKTKSLVEEAGTQALLIPGDIQVESHCNHIIDATLDRFGRIDILINNAAYQESQESIEDVTSEYFDKVFRTNVFAMFYLCRKALQHMQPGGAIINSASIQGYRPSANLLPYASSKSAIIGFTKALAQSAMEKGVRVNAVAPGPVWTPLIPSTMPPEKFQNFGDNTVFQRPAQQLNSLPFTCGLLTGSDIHHGRSFCCHWWDDAFLNGDRRAIQEPNFRRSGDRTSA